MFKVQKNVIEPELLGLSFMLVLHAREVAYVGLGWPQLFAHRFEIITVAAHDTHLMLGLGKLALGFFNVGL
ncbi:hypothetical protein ASE39_02495 [Acidovorax sp. Root267]|nr:hypothetical protein ASE39_02495 [Acidovorax sp. Root267]